MSETDPRIAPAAALDPTETDLKGKPLKGRLGHKKGPEPKIWPKDWLEIYQMVRNGVPVSEISKKYKIQKSTIYRRCKAQNVKPGLISPSNQDAQAVADRAALVIKVRETKENDYKFTDFLQRKVMKIVAGADAAGQALGLVMDDIKAAKAALDAIRVGTDNKWRLLGLDKENVDADSMLQELPIRELTPAEMVAMRDRQAIEDLGDEALDRLDAEADPDDLIEFDPEDMLPEEDLEDEPAA